LSPEDVKSCDWSLLWHNRNMPLLIETDTYSLLTYLLTHSLTPWCRILFEKQIVTKFVRKCPAFLWNPKVHYRVHTSSLLDPIPSQLNPVRPIHLYLRKVHLNVFLLPTPRSSQWSLAFGPPNQNPVNTSPLPHACHMSSPPHPRFNHPNNIRWGIQAMMIIIMQFSSRSVFLSFWSKYLPQHPVLKNPQSVYLPQSERSSFAPMQHNWQNYSFVYFNL
jgi:hypothetical protein